MVTYAEAITTKTATALQADLVTELAADGVTATGFSPTSVSRGQIALNARAIGREQEIRAEVVKSGLLLDPQQRDPAWIDRMVEGFFSVPRIRATRARHLFTLTNQTQTGGPYEIKASGASGAGSVLTVSSTDGVLFRSAASGVLPAGFGSTAEIEFEAVNAGPTGNIGPGDIFKIQGGALPGVDIANLPDSQILVARADETNVEYVTRALGRWGSLAAGGHPGAVRFRILTGVPSLTKLGVADDNPFGPGTVGVYLANAAGPATGGELTAAEAVFGPYEPLGSRGLWSYLPCSPRVVPLEATLYLDGTNPDALDNAETALRMLEAQWPIGETAPFDTALVLGAMAGGAFPKYMLPGFGGVTDVDIFVFNNDVTLLSDQVLVLDMTLTQG